MVDLSAINGLCYAASSTNFAAFCALIGNVQDSYAEGKYRDFQQIARLLGRFDDNVLTVLIEKGLSE